MKFYVCTDVTHTHTHTQTHTDTHRHTHTPCLWQGGVRANEVKMRVKRGMKMR